MEKGGNKSKRSRGTSLRPQRASEYTVHSTQRIMIIKKREREKEKEREREREKEKEKERGRME